MKKLHFVVAASALVLASCAEEFTPQPVEQGTPVDGTPMSFTYRSTNISRTGETPLNDEQGTFGVWAIKSDDAEGLVSTGLTSDENLVMKNYMVAYSTYWHYPASGIGEHSEWWYEGLGKNDGYYPGTTPSVNDNQYLKYWDQGKTFTSFFAYSPYTEKDADPVTFATSAGKATISFPYVVTMNSGAATLYAGQIELNADHNAAGTTVPLVFNRITSKIRLGVYEDIKGYHVEMINVAYNTLTGDHGILSFPTTYDAATEKYSRGSIVFQGKPYVDYTLPATLAKGAFTTTNTTVGFSEVERHGHEAHTFMEFAIPSTNLTTVGSHNFISQAGGLDASMSETVYNVIPNNGTDLGAVTLDGATATAHNDGIQLVMNFRLVSDDTGEVITVKNARVWVSDDYTQWKPNMLYTYIFKITKGTTGTTKPDPEPEPEPDPDPDPALYPIVFDNIVVAPLTETLDASDTGNDHEL